MKREIVDRLYDYYQRIDRRPPAAVGSLPVLRPSKRIEQFEERVRALRLPIDPLAGRSTPPIELLVVAAPKDFSLLELATRSALVNAGNPILNVTFVVPAAALADAEAIATRLLGDASVKVTSEDDVIPIEDRNLLFNAFGPRYGWILQQVLCVAGVSESNSAGVLILDADTLLLRPRVLLSGNRQILMSSLEHHYPYFEFLESLSPHFRGMQTSHVTHHMLQQPEVSRSILEEFCGGDISSLVRLIVERRTNSTASAVCVEYELYAQGIRLLYPERVLSAKWSNISVDRRVASSRNIESMANFYCSASLHDHFKQSLVLGDRH